MRVRSFAALAAVLLLSSACSSVSSTGAGMSAAPAPAVVAVRPAGEWNVALIAQGQALDLVMSIKDDGDAKYSGTVTSQMFPPISFNNATLNGNRMRIAFVAPTGDQASIDIVFDGDTFTGDWAMPGDGSKVSGKRVR